MHSANNDESLVRWPAVFIYKRTPTQLHTHSTHTQHTHKHITHASMYGGPLTHPLTESNKCAVIRLRVSHHTNPIYWDFNMIFIIIVCRATGQLV